MAKRDGGGRQLEPYVKAHQAQFTRPERRRFQYVVFDPKMFLSGLGPGGRGLLQAHEAEFEQPRRVTWRTCWCGCRRSGEAEAENKAKARSRPVIKRRPGG